MSPRTPPSLDRDAVAAHFQQRAGQGYGRYLRIVAHHVMSMILDQEGFDSLESLIAFCDDSDNLESWLPNEVDRVVFSHEFVEGLRELSSGPATAADVFHLRNGRQ